MRTGLAEIEDPQSGTVQEAEAPPAPDEPEWLVLYSPPAFDRDSLESW